MLRNHLIQKVREEYLSQFHATMEALVSEGTQIIAEAVYRNSDGSLARDGPFALPLRGDIFVFSGNQPLKVERVDSKSALSFESFILEEAADPAVRIAPFHWDACNFRIRGIHNSTNWELLKDWFTHWFDEEDSNPTDVQGLSGVIHFLSDPEYEGSLTLFQVDFGSAPIEAFEELLHVLQALAATLIEVGY